MASTSANGVVLKVPYAILNTVNSQWPWTLSVVGADLRATAYDQKQLRTFPAGAKEATNGIFVYVGDIITFSLIMSCNSTGAAAYNLNSVNFTTGATSLAATIGFNAVWQKNIVVTITAIGPVSGAVSFTTARS